MSGEPEGHETHLGYGVVPKQDATPVNDNAEKDQGQMGSEPTANTGLLAFVPGEHNRDSTTSTLLLPHSFGDDQRNSATSTTLLLPPSPRADQRQSTGSSLYISHSAEGDMGQSSQHLPEQDPSEILMNADNEEMSEIPLTAEKPKTGADQ
jgi:hypothetical protein